MRVKGDNKSDELIVGRGMMLRQKPTSIIRKSKRKDIPNPHYVMMEVYSPDADKEEMNNMNNFCN